MKKISLNLLVIAALLAAAGLLLSCNKKDDALPEVWEIPFLNSLTGPIASIGEYLQWSAEFAANQINENGGIAGRPVKIVRIDTGLSPEKGTVEMSKLVDSALVVMGPVPEPVIMAAVPIAADEGVYCFTATTSFEYASQYFPWAISWFPPTEEALHPAVTRWAEMVKAKRVVQFVENYGAWPGMADAHNKGLENAGCTILNEVEVPVNAVSFDALIVKALAQKPDSLVFSCSAEKAARIIVELKSRGWSSMKNILVFSVADDAAFYTTGGSSIDGVVIYNYSDPHLDTPGWNEFRSAFKSSHNGLEPFALAPNYYDSVYMIKRAIEETGVTGNPKLLAEERVKIRDYCNEIDKFEGLQFEWSNRGGYPADKPVFLFEIKDGAKVLLATVTAK